MRSIIPDVWFRGAYFVWRRDLTVYAKTFHMNILPNFFEPLIYLLAMGFGLGAYLREDIGGLSYLAFITPGLIVSSAMNGASFETTYNVFVKMHFGRTYQAITSTPVNIEDAMFGEVLWAVTRGMIYGAGFSIVVLCFGLLPGFSFLGMLPVLLLTSFLFAGVGLCFTSFIRAIDLYSFYYTLFLTPMFLFSGIFFPLDGLPAWVRAIAFLFPLSHCVTLGKAVVHGNLPVSGVILESAWILFLAIALILVALNRIRHRHVV